MVRQRNDAVVIVPARHRGEDIFSLHVAHEHNGGWLKGGLIASVTPEHIVSLRALAMEYRCRIIHDGSVWRAAS